ncbi:MAG: hypothetical protein EZS28_039359, partial [Streblomastix strix]
MLPNIHDNETLFDLYIPVNVLNVTQDVQINFEVDPEDATEEIPPDTKPISGPDGISLPVVIIIVITVAFFGFIIIVILVVCIVMMKKRMR